MPEASSTTELISVETPESVAFAYELAGLGSRGMALALDTLLIGLLTLAEVTLGAALYAAVGALSSWAAAMRALPWIAGLGGVAVFATSWLYFVHGEVRKNGRTWGKKRLGLRVVREDGSRVGLLDSVIRNLLRLVDMLPGNYAIGMAAILLSAKHQRLGDMAAGTVVVRDSGELDAHFDGGDTSKPVLLAREYLARRGSLTPDARRQVGEAVLRALGEEPGRADDESSIAARIEGLSR